MSLNVELLRSSFEMVVDRAPNLTQRFYEILFQRYPQTREMFPPTRREKQENMLTQALVAVMDHLEDAPWLVSTLHALGARHVGYGVTNEMYSWVGSSLLSTLREVAGDDWTPELENAWGAAYWAIADLMREGARLAAERNGAPSTERTAHAPPPSSA
ncbi:MAG TPA: globin domain-containing protein [Polyangiaceae bacterium]|jgi:hemoglobin-like flavoprotein|nr:globin domain-containing protein [Polyangiaceae bacterium]